MDGVWAAGDLAGEELAEVQRVYELLRKVTDQEHCPSRLPPPRATPEP
jgi:hypothetical protein